MKWIEGERIYSARVRPQGGTGVRLAGPPLYVGVNGIEPLTSAM